jgi:hypothetical protein
MAHDSMADSFLTRRNKLILRYNYSIESKKTYQYPACQIYNKDEINVYVAKCEDGNLAIQHDFPYFKNLEAIEKEVLLKDLFLKLQSHVTDSLGESLNVFTNIKKCIKSNIQSSSCEDYKSTLLKKVRNELPRLRVLAAQMNLKGHEYSPEKISRYRKNIHHPQSNITAKPLSENENRFLNNHTQAVEAVLEQKVLQSSLDIVGTDKIDYPIRNLAPCMSFNEDNILALKEGSLCEHFDVIVQNRVDLEFTKDNANYENEYYNMIEKNILLQYLTVRGDESDEEILNNIANAVTPISKQISKEISNVNSLNENASINTFNSEHYENIANYQTQIASYLKQQNPPSQIQCDLVETISAERDLTDFREKAIIGLSSLAGVTVCTYASAGLCAASAGVAGELGMFIAEQREVSDAKSRFLAGAGSKDWLDQKAFERNLTVALLPITLSGTAGIIKHTNAGGDVFLKVEVSSAQATYQKFMDQLEGSLEASTLGKISSAEKRIDTSQREVIDEIFESDIHNNWKEYLNLHFGDDMQYLSRTEKVYLAGIAEELKKRIQSTSNLSSKEVDQLLNKQLSQRLLKCDSKGR